MKLSTMAAGVMCVVVLGAGAARAEGDQAGGHKEGKKTPADRFAAADTNGDGAVSLEEFKAMQTRRQERMRKQRGDDAKLPAMPPAEEVFARLDTDQSGTLSKEELAAGGAGRPRRHEGKGERMKGADEGAAGQPAGQPAEQPAEQPADKPAAPPAEPPAQ